MCKLVMCTLQGTYDSDPTPAIVSPIPTPEKSESLFTPRVVVVWVGVVRVGIVRSTESSSSESSGVVRSRLKSSVVV